MGDIPKRLESIDEFLDSRARFLAREYHVRIDEIIRLYLELEKELEDNNREIVINMTDPDTPLTIFQNYKRKFASGAILHYELTKREALRLPVCKEPFAIRNNNKIESGTAFLNGTFYRRDIPVSSFEATGKFYEKFVEKINEMEVRNIEAMLDSNK